MSIFGNVCLLFYLVKYYAGRGEMKQTNDRDNALAPRFFSHTITGRDKNFNRLVIWPNFN